MYFRKDFFPQCKAKNISTADNLLMRGFLVCLSEGSPDIISDRLLWPGAKF